MRPTIPVSASSLERFKDSTSAIGLTESNILSENCCDISLEEGAALR